MERKWIPHFAELIDRLSIHQLKEIFIAEHRKKYFKEMEDISFDLNTIIKEKNVKLTGELVRAIIILSQINTHIWYNEAEARKGKSQDLNLLKLTHGLNGMRSQIQNYILNLVGDTKRMDWKTDCLAAEFKDWQIGLLEEREIKND